MSTSVDKNRGGALFITAMVTVSEPITTSLAISAVAWLPWKPVWGVARILMFPLTFMGAFSISMTTLPLGFGFVMSLVTHKRLVKT